MAMYDLPFTQINKDQFLANYWQKTPCVFKNAFPSFKVLVSADELAGLSLDEQIDSRLVIQNDDNWLVEHGPFDEGRFNTLPTENWTLLVQSVDHYVPTIHSLLDDFNFIPRWRLDDIMVSYATNKGGVGPHTDNYDVFIIQADGVRRWRISAKGEVHPQCSQVGGLSQVAEFEPHIDITLEPGDMLYIPPDTAHWGVSLGDSIAYSIGFRSPQTHQLLGLLAEELSTNIDKSQFFSDSYRSSAVHYNKIEPELIEWAQNELRELARQPNRIASLLSQHLSLSKMDTKHSLLPDKKQSISDSSSFKIESCYCANWYISYEQLILSIEGERFIFPPELVEVIQKLANYQVVSTKMFKNTIEPFDFLDVLTSLITKGYVKQVNSREQNDGIAN